MTYNCARSSRQRKQLLQKRLQSEEQEEEQEESQEEEQEVEQEEQQEEQGEKQEEQQEEQEEQEVKQEEEQEKVLVANSRVTLLIKHPLRPPELLPQLVHWQKFGWNCIKYEKGRNLLQGRETQIPGLLNSLRLNIMPCQDIKETKLN